MCLYIVSATTLLKWRGQAVPMIRYDISVSVIMAAPSAMRMAVSKLRLMSS